MEARKWICLVVFSGAPNVFREKNRKYKAELLQMKLFEDEEEMSKTFRFAEKVPYKFSYVFTTEDGKQRTLRIGK